MVRWRVSLVDAEDLIVPECYPKAAIVRGFFRFSV